MRKSGFFFIVAVATLCSTSCHRGKNIEESEIQAVSDSLTVGSEWTGIAPEDLDIEPVALFSRDWMALAVGNSKSYNAMTIGWGTIGQLWGRPVLCVFVSSDRATKKFMDSNQYFSVTGFPAGKIWKDALVYLGSHSFAEEEDKVAGSGLSVDFTELGTPFFSDGRIAIECRKLYSAPFDPEKIPQEIMENTYAELGMHTMYVGEIINVWEKR